MICYLTTPEELQTLIDKKNVFIIYKYNSGRCRISDTTTEQVQEAHKEGNIQHIYFVDIINNRDVSDSITEITKITHESPQAIVFKEGKVIAHTSHMHITKDRILENNPFGGKK